MIASSRFAVATHILTLLALHRDEPVTSETIAASVNTNPVVIRRVMAGLREAGIVTSQPGAGGGWRLVGCPDEVTLRDVFRAVEPEQVFALHPKSPSASCLVGQSICRALEGIFHEAEVAMEERLARTTVAEVLHSVMPASEHGTTGIISAANS